MNDQLNMRTFIACFLLALTAGCVGPMKDWPNVQSGEKTVEPVIQAIKAYRAAHGKYPESLDALGLPEKVMEDVSVRKLHYLLRENGSIASVSFRPRPQSDSKTDFRCRNATGESLKTHPDRIKDPSPKAKKTATENFQKVADACSSCS